MNRSEFQQLADVRIDEAGVLLAAGKWAGAYDLAGYAVECALKACVANRTPAEAFPPRKTDEYYTHDLNVLLKTANLVSARDVYGAEKPTFASHWRTVALWKEDARYRRIDEPDAKALIEAITDPTDGVLQSIRRHW
ncbi:MAG: DNA-binding protein [Planctomycetes bacterium]|nr:DNA-binding protein [Planctomycetota bacterium]